MLRVSVGQGSDRIREALVPRACVGLGKEALSALGEHLLELLAGADAELQEDLVQVVLDRLAADKEFGGNVLIRRAVARHSRDPCLVRGEVVSRLSGSFAGGLACS